MLIDFVVWCTFLANCSLSLDSTLRTFISVMHARTLMESKFWWEDRGVSKSCVLPHTLAYGQQHAPYGTPAWQSGYDNHGYKVGEPTHQPSVTNNSQVLILLIPTRSVSPAALSQHCTRRIESSMTNNSQVLILLSLHALFPQRLLSKHGTRTSADKPISISLRHTKSLWANIGHA